MGFPGSSASKESACNAGDLGLIPGSGRSPGARIGYPFECSWASRVIKIIKNQPTWERRGFYPWVGKIPWRRAWQPTLEFLPGESPWTEEPGRLQSKGLHKVRHDWSDLAQIIVRNSYHSEGVGIIENLSQIQVSSDWILSENLLPHSSHYIT